MGGSLPDRAREPLTLAVTIFVADVISGIPLTLNVSHWSATASNWSLAGLMALACFAFYASRGSQPLLGGVLRDS